MPDFADEMPELLAPVTFTGDDALRFLEELPDHLPRPNKDELRKRVGTATAFISDSSTNDLLLRHPQRAAD